MSEPSNVCFLSSSYSSMHADCERSFHSFWRRSTPILDSCHECHFVCLEMFSVLVSGVSSALFDLPLFVFYLPQRVSGSERGRDERRWVVRAIMIAVRVSDC